MQSWVVAVQRCLNAVAGFAAPAHLVNHHGRDRRCPQVKLGLEPGFGATLAISAPFENDPRASPRASYQRAATALC